MSSPASDRPPQAVPAAETPSDPGGRRRFLRAGATATAAWVPMAGPASNAVAQPSAPAAPTAAPGPSAPALRWLLPHEAEALQVLVGRIIPADALGPGAREAGVVGFIDGQCAGAYGQGSRSYRQGPWHEGTPEQGYQAALAPAELLRHGLEALDAYCRKARGAPVAQWFDESVDALLQGLERGSVPLGAVSSPLFFEQLLQLTIEGFFADPIHGGNAGKVGWRLVGYPGAAAAYLGVVGQHGRPYRVEPVSLVDLYAGTAEHDGIGHAVHRERR